MTWGKRRAIVIGLLILALIVLVWAASKPTGMRLPTNGVLVINASGEIEEQKAPDIFSALNGGMLAESSDSESERLPATRTNQDIQGVRHEVVTVLLRHVAEQR